MTIRFRGDCFDQLLRRATPVVASGERIDLRKMPRPFLGFAALVNLLSKIDITAPTEDYERDIEEQCIDQRGLRRAYASVEVMAGDLRHHRSADADEHDDCGCRNAEQDDIPLRLVQAGPLLRLVPRAAVHCWSLGWFAFRRSPSMPLGTENRVNARLQIRENATQVACACGTAGRAGRSGHMNP